MTFTAYSDYGWFMPTGQADDMLGHVKIEPELASSIQCLQVKYSVAFTAETTNLKKTTTKQLTSDEGSEP
jgi:hypothetical protein